MKIIKIPFSGAGLGHGNGANKAPDKIIEQLNEMFANEEGKKISIKTEEIDVDENNFGKSHEEIKKYFMTHKEPAISIGGDHSITHPIIKGLVSEKDENFEKGKYQFVVFDAHPDLMDDFRPPTQEDYLRVLIEEKIIYPEDIILIGIRNWDEEEVNYLKENNIKYYRAKDIFEKGVKKTTEEVVTKILRTKKQVYLSIDIDAVDPVEAIGTGYLEHGGLSSRELIYFLQKIKQTNLISHTDIVEVNPEKDIRDLTSKLAAKLITELL